VDRAQACLQKQCATLAKVMVITRWAGMKTQAGGKANAEMAIKRNHAAAFAASVPRPDLVAMASVKAASHACRRLSLATHR
jgi:hypothetical protein